METSITDISDVGSEDDECCSVSSFLYLTLGVDSALSYDGGGFQDSLLQGLTNEDVIAYEWQEFVTARASTTRDGVTSLVTHEYDSSCSESCLIYQTLGEDSKMLVSEDVS